MPSSVFRPPRTGWCSCGRRTLTAQQLEGLPLLLPHRLNVRGQLANWFGDRFSRLNIAYTGNLSTNSMLLVAAGGAYALVVAGSVPFLDPARLTVRPLSPPLRSGAVFAWRREQPQSPAVQRFIDHAKCLLGMDQA